MNQQNYFYPVQGLLSDQPQPEPRLPLDLLIELLRNGQQSAFLDQLRPKVPPAGTTTTGIRG